VRDSQTADALRDTLAEDRREWVEALESVYREFGEEAVRYLLRSLQDHAIGRGIVLSEATLNTPYVNTIPVAEQPPYPGQLALESRIENIIRWNAMAMVLKAQDAGTGVGGHIATYTSASTLLEVGFNHFFRAGAEGESDDPCDDLVLPQPHASPGIYARAYLEGRLDEQQLLNFRRELGSGGGLSSYPHPRSMPDFWQMPNASMGLSTPAAIYQARFARYLANRGLKRGPQRRIWCFIGDGEADEPEVLGTINIAAREQLDNLVLVINCNLQRLDGPVRGNGKIIQELERSFRGADWHVIKVIWGSGWDALLANDRDGILRARMEACVDGDYQRYSILSGGEQREHWVQDNPALAQMMASLTDDELRTIKRGGHDPKKLYAAYLRACQSKGRPTVILVKTVKGEGMGESAQGRNTAHQKKNLNAEERIRCGRDWGIPLTDEALARADFYRPAEESEELNYLQARRQALGGYLPRRRISCPTLEPPTLASLERLLAGSGERPTSTTQVAVRLLSTLLRDPTNGRYIVPIVPDEARTFGMDGLFKQAGIYSPAGQRYTPVDADTLLPYREAADGQILQEGICEAGAMASFMAAGSAYAVHGVPTIPFYIFYSMFGFQRVGDMIWACADMMCRGFLLGGTAGRTTLNGEGLQHQDGHSHILASTVPSVRAYDPAFGYELALIVRDGIRRMYREGEDCFYYLTVYNAAYPMPALPDQPDVAEGVLRGGYCLQRSAAPSDWPQVHLLGSGAIMEEVLRARELLEAQGCRVDVWSITSYSTLAREAMDASVESPWVAQLFRGEAGLFVAATDYMRALPESISRWVPGPYRTLGTDGFGLSESRAVLREHFGISADAIAGSALAALRQSSPT